jgi:hypothetical protein
VRENLQNRKKYLSPWKIQREKSNLHEIFLDGFFFAFWYFILHSLKYFCPIFSNKIKKPRARKKGTKKRLAKQRQKVIKVPFSSLLILS